MTNTNNKANYFKIGSFVLVGIGLIVFSLLIFGTEKIFQPVVYVESYFEESIRGISEGTPVRYRGLQIGYVEDVAFTTEIYSENKMDRDQKIYTRSIYIKIAITSKLFTDLSDTAVEKFLSRKVAQGLRVKLATQGLTGINYLEFDYVDPKTNPIPTLDWSPENFYMPSSASTLARLSENAQHIINELKDVDFKKLFSGLNNLVVSLDRVSDKTDQLLNRIGTPVTKSLQNLKIISENLRTLSDRLKLKPSELIFSSYPPPLDPNKL